MPALNKLKVVKVSCGECHSAFLTDKGDLFTCGDNRYGKLGLNQKTYNSIQFDAVQVQKFKELKVDSVACGGCHMILIGKLRKKAYDDDSDEGNRSSRRERSLRDDYDLKNRYVIIKFKDLGCVFSF